MVESGWYYFFLFFFGHCKVLLYLVGKDHQTWIFSQGKGKPSFFPDLPFVALTMLLHHVLLFLVSKWWTPRRNPGQTPFFIKSIEVCCMTELAKPCPLLGRSHDAHVNMSIKIYICAIYGLCPTENDILYICNCHIIIALRWCIISCAVLLQELLQYIRFDCRCTLGCEKFNNAAFC